MSDDLRGMRKSLRNALMRDPEGPRSKQQRRTSVTTAMGQFEQAVRVDELARSVPRMRSAVQRATAQAMEPLADRIRFVAGLALLDTWSRDGRLLARALDLPVGQVRHRDYPIPVQGPDYPLAQVAAFITRVVHVPETDDLMAVGWFHRDAEGRELSSRMAAGDLFLELDVDDHRVGDVAWPPPPPSGPLDPTPLAFTDWRVSRAVLGTHPCWDLAPAQIVPAMERWTGG